MLAGMRGAQKIGLGALAAIGLAGTGFIGSRYLGKPAPIEMRQGVVTADGEALVHVVGAVKKPGLVTLRTSERVNDAIDKAGGATEDADLNGINLAQRVVDGMQITVASKTEVATGDTGSGVSVPEPTKAASSSAAVAPGGTIAINSADATQLEELPGVGPATSAKIIEYRQAHGGFKTIDELMEVKGIGPKKLEKMRPYLRL